MRGQQAMAHVDPSGHWMLAPHDLSRGAMPSNISFVARVRCTAWFGATCGFDPIPPVPR